MIADMPLWTGQTWALIAAAATFLAVAWAIRELRRAPTKPADLSNLDTADGVTEGQPACWNTGPRGGHYVKALGAYWTCPACGSMWPRNNTEPYDQEASHVVDAAERIVRGEVG